MMKTRSSDCRIQVIFKYIEIFTQLDHDMNHETNLNKNLIDYVLRQRGTGLEFLYNNTTINTLLN